MGCRIYLSFVKTPRLAEFKNTSFPLGCSPYAPSPCLLLCTNLQIHRIIYKAVGDLLPADASVRVKPEEGCELLSASWAGDSECLHFHTCFFSTMLGLGAGGCPWCFGGWLLLCLGFFFNFLKFVLPGKGAAISLCITSECLCCGFSSSGTYCKSVLLI